MFDLEIRMLFLNYNMNKDLYKKELKTTTDEKTIVDLKNKIEKLDKLQLELIEEHLELVGSELPLEMQGYFSGEKPHIDKSEILINWLTAYKGG